MSKDFSVWANFRMYETLPDGSINVLVEVHNILVNWGRHHVITALVSGTTAYIKYMGFGIGGDGSDPTSPPDPGSVNSAFDTDYPGTNTYSDTDPAIDRLERPVIAYQSGGTDYWLVEPTYSYIGASPYTGVTFTYTFGADDLNIGTYPVVPISECALFLSTQDPAVDPYSATPQVPFAYATFSPQNKNSGSTPTIEWRLRI